MAGSLFKNLSMYGWISTIICGIICIIFAAVSYNSDFAIQTVVPCVNGSTTSTDDGATTDDGDNQGCEEVQTDDKYGSDDLCYSGSASYQILPLPSFFPKSLWTLNLALGVCFKGDMPDTDSFWLPTSVYVEADKGERFCIPWDATVGDNKVFRDSGEGDSIATSFCKSVSGISNAIFFDSSTPEAIVPEDLSFCSEYGNAVKSFASGANAVAAAAAFAAIATLFGIVGTFLAQNALRNGGKVEGNEGNERSRQIVQVICGLCFLIYAMCTWIFWDQTAFSSNNNKNPFFNAFNIQAFGCLFGYQTSASAGTLSLGSTFSMIIAFIIAISQGGVNLTTRVCDNRCCCPCCFLIENTTATTAGGAVQVVAGPAQTGYPVQIVGGQQYGGSQQYVVGQQYSGGQQYVVGQQNGGGHQYVVGQQYGASQQYGTGQQQQVVGVQV